MLAGAIAVPARLPNPKKLADELPVLLHIADDCDARFGLTTKSLLLLMRTHGSMEKIKTFAGKRSGLSWPDIKWISPSYTGTDKTDIDFLKTASETIDKNTIAFLQYTSGSTSLPKGVIIKHENLVHNLELIKRSLKTNEDSTLLGWVPLYHDLGLTGGILNAFYSNSQAIYFSPLGFLKSPKLWLELLSKYKATHATAPNFAFEYALRDITPIRSV